MEQQLTLRVCRSHKICQFFFILRGRGERGSSSTRSPENHDFPPSPRMPFPAPRRDKGYRTLLSLPEIDFLRCITSFLHAQGEASSP